MGFDVDRDRGSGALAEINVTPLVDVMLVLLIIFMITAPMLHHGIEVALPKADAAPIPVRHDDPLVLSINRAGLIYLRDEPIHATRLDDGSKRMAEIIDKLGVLSTDVGQLRTTQLANGPTLKEHP